MLDLFSIKLNNTKYDFVQSTVPETNGLWLCDATSADYVRGYSYEVKGNQVTRIESALDYRIEEAIEPTIKLVKKFLGYDLVKHKGCCGDNICIPFWQPKEKCLPSEVDSIIAKMMYYDFYLRGQSSDLKSENVGNYSYTKEDYQVGSLYYPSDIASQLEVYKKVRFL